MFEKNIMRSFLLFIFVFSLSSVHAQVLHPGFELKEYEELLSVIDHQNAFFDTTNARFPVGSNYSLAYSSPEMGLKNKWDLWKRSDKVGVVVLRGTVPSPVSWLANFYSGMIPATGELQLNDSTVFKYQLAQDPKAGVQAGWTTSLAYIGPDIAEKIKFAYAEGYHEFIICGHSQGGALAFLVRSYLEYLPGMPKDILYKTYCSAAPKPGNMYYSYDFDYINRTGWGLRVINAADWVPESPFTIQRLSDMNPANPFMGIDGALDGQPWIIRLVVKSKYNKLNRKTRKAEQTYTKNLGHFIFGQVKKQFPQMKEPSYLPSQQFMTAGTPIILQPDSAYQQKYIFTGKNVFIHHGLHPYFELAERGYSGSK